MIRKDCDTCAGTGVAFGKRCTCSSEQCPSTIGSAMFWQVASAWAGATLDTQQRAEALVDFILQAQQRQAAADDLTKCRNCGNYAALSEAAIAAQNLRYEPQGLQAQATNARASNQRSATGAVDLSGLQRFAVDTEYEYRDIRPRGWGLFVKLADVQALFAPPAKV